MNIVDDIQKNIQSVELDSADGNNEETAAPEGVKSDEDKQKEVEIKSVHSRQQQTQQRKSRPRLDRTNAKKYSNDDDEYDGERGGDASTLFSFSTIPEEEDCYTDFRIGGSDGGEIDRICLTFLGLSGPARFGSSTSDRNESSYAGRTSFRTGGSDCGEIERICVSLGLSGPEDFAISPSDWKESRANSSSDLHSNLNPHFYHVNNSLVSNNNTKLEKKKVYVVDKDGAVVVVGGGIKGVRSPLLGHHFYHVNNALVSNNNSKLEKEKVDVVDKDGAVVVAVDGGGGGGLKGKYTSIVSHSEANSLDEDEQEELEIGGTVFVIDRDEELDGESLGKTDSSSFTMSYSEDYSSTTTEHNIINGSFRRNIRWWTKGTSLGSGSYGTVYEGFTDDGFFFAVKELSLLVQGNQGWQSILEQEIALLSRFEHENIVRYFGTHKVEDKLYIFLELVTKGSLLQLYQKHDLRDSQVSSYTRQILHGLKYLHDQNIIHRNIKCANILVDADGSVKLADFGLAKTTRLNDIKSSKGTAFWMAPEVVNRKKTSYGLPADIWSLGCTVLEMLTHQLPYTPLEWMQATYRIGKGEPPSVPDNLSPDARDFILNCLQVKPEDRPTAATLLDHSFLSRSLPSSSGSDSPFHSRWR